MKSNSENFQSFSLRCGNALAELNGPKLLNLTLSKDTKDVEVISPALNETEFVKSGSFFMYPWVGRMTKRENLFNYLGYELEESQFAKMDTQRGFPLHGFYISSERKCINQTESSVSFESVDEKYFTHFPKFTETYTLNEESLEIKTNFTNLTDKVQYFAYAHHPYIGINRQNIADLTIKSNCDVHYDQQPDLVPKLDSEGRVVKGEKTIKDTVIGSSFYDDLFFQGEGEDSNPYLELSDKAGVRVRVESVASKDYLSMRFCQIYTPESRTSIAVEFMTSINDAFNINYPNSLVRIEAHQSLVGLTRISLK